MNISQQPPLSCPVQDRTCTNVPEEQMRLATEFNSDHLHWDEVRRRDTKGIDPKRIWALMMFLRKGKDVPLKIGNLSLRYSIMDGFQRSLNEIDRISSGGSLFDRTDEKRTAKRYSVSSLMEESIASSQMEGASTTTRVAKTMLREGRRPKDRSERMILNNYLTMQFIKENKDQKMTPQLISDIHRTITEGVLDDPSYEGKFRDSDDIVITDGITGEVFHEPPMSSEIPYLIDSLCEYINSDEFIHPVVKGIIIHFLIAYIHPFTDGNGRLARSLQYWYSLKEGYNIFEYLAISRIIKERRSNYDRAYLLSETDGLDVTYFIKYILNCVRDSVGEFIRYVERKRKEYEEFVSSYEGYDLNMRQRSILSDSVMSGEPFSISEIRTLYQVSYQTATNDVNKMESLGLLKKYAKDWNRVLYVPVKTNKKDKKQVH